MKARDALGFGLLTGLVAVLVDALATWGLYGQFDLGWPSGLALPALYALAIALGTYVWGRGIIPGLALSAACVVLHVALASVAPHQAGSQDALLWASDPLWAVGLMIHFVAVLDGYVVTNWLWTGLTELPDGGVGAAPRLKLRLLSR